MLGLQVNLGKSAVESRFGIAEFFPELFETHGFWWNRVHLDGAFV
jgi:hypothetical protein